MVVSKTADDAVLSLPSRGRGHIYRLFPRILVILPSSISPVKPLDRPLYRMLQSSVDPCMGRYFFLSIRCGWAAEMQQT